MTGLGPFLAEVARLRAMSAAGVEAVRFELDAATAFAIVDRFVLLDQLERDTHGHIRNMLGFAGLYMRCQCGVEGWEVQREDIAALFTEEAIRHECGAEPWQRQSIDDADELAGIP